MVYCVLALSPATFAPPFAVRSGAAGRHEEA
jgi:hypothetical protein